MCSSSNGEHLLGHVDPDNGEAMSGQESGHAAWPTSDVGDLTTWPSFEQLDERCEQRPIDGVLGGCADLGSDEVHIPRRRRVVDRAGGSHVLGVSHALRLRGRPSRPRVPEQ